MRAFYRIKRSDWGGQADARPLGGTQALLIVHSAIYPNPAIEALTGSKFLGNTYAEFMAGGIATATQKAKVFETEWENGVDGDGNPVRGRSKNDRVPGGAVARRTNLIPHAWGAREGTAEQAAVDDLE